MNLVLHLELSQIIRKAVEKELDIKINTLSFMYGNIKPDIIPTSVSHYKHTVMEFVQGEIEKLASLRFNKSKRWLKQFSERMGIITHYLSDFFVMPILNSSSTKLSRIFSMNSSNYTILRKTKS